MKSAWYAWYTTGARRLLGITLAGALSACGCAERKEPQVQTNPTPNGADTTAQTESGSHTDKPSAPVKITATLAATSAAVEIVFGEDASDVTVDVWGVDGLVVTSAATPIAGRAFARGEKLPLSVSLTAPATRADLAVRVRGTFAGRARVEVRSFTVNAGAPPPQPAAGEVRLGPDGLPVRVMKAE